MYSIALDTCLIWVYDGSIINKKRNMKIKCKCGCGCDYEASTYEEVNKLACNNSRMMSYNEYSKKANEAAEEQEA